MKLDFNGKSVFIVPPEMKKNGGYTLNKSIKCIRKNIKGFFALIILISVFSLIPVSGETTFVTVDEKFYSHFPPTPPEEKNLRPHTNAFKETVNQEFVMRDNPNYVIDLLNGWNVISVPKRLLTGYNTGAAVFGHIDTGGRSIFLYNGATQQWTQLGPNDIVHPLDGIFIYSVGPNQVNLYFDGTQPDPAQKTVYNQWNLVGFWDVYQACARDTLISIDPGWSYVMGYDAVNQGYEPSIYNSEPSRQKLMFPGKGYWLWMNGGDTMEYPKDKTYFVGGEYVDTYHGIENLTDVNYGFNNVDDFIDGLDDANNWNERFMLENDDAWERHWKEGAMDSSYVDNVHFAYFHGHGCEEAIKFGTYHDDPTLSYSEARWGNTMLDWVALDACNVLTDPEESNLWRESFAGLHGIYSFASNSYSVTNRGSAFASYLIDGKTIWEAWKLAVIESTPTGSHQIAAVLTAKDDNPSSLDCYYDHIYGEGYSINPPGYPSDFDYETYPI